MSLNKAYNILNSSYFNLEMKENLNLNIDNISFKKYNDRFNNGKNNIIIVNNSFDDILSVQARNNQAENYLLHAKFPTQIAVFKNWLLNLTSDMYDGTVFDFGCGPGPYTKILLENGYKNIIAVDNSLKSLVLNQQSCISLPFQPVFLLQDIRKIKLMENSVSILVMADFLQHIINVEERKSFLNYAFKSLKPGGVFFLSFFNINIKNYFKNDISGTFSNGKISYNRLNYKDVLSQFPSFVKVEKILPMNIFNNSFYDKYFCRLPLAKYFSRMIVIQGTKR